MIRLRIQNDYLEASEFLKTLKFRCGLGGVRGEQSGFPRGMIVEEERGDASSSGTSEGREPL